MILINDIVVLHNYSLQEHNSLKINSIAEFYTEIFHIDILMHLMNHNFFNDKEFKIIGNGTNILLKKKFYNGIIIKNSMFDKIVFSINEDNCIEMTVASGEEVEYLIMAYINYQEENDIIAYGLENLTGIPGSIGAAVCLNIGAYGVEQKDFFVSCEAINMKTRETRTFSKEECLFDYRSSYFTKNPNEYFITYVKYAVPINNKPFLYYKELNSHFITNDIKPRHIFDFVKEIRSNKIPNPLFNPNAGSFFKNPIVSKDKLHNILKLHPDIKYEKLVLDTDDFTNESSPLNYNSNNREVFKISAAYLIENCGLKGYRSGEVGISNKHALIIINYGNATGKDIINFSNFIIQQVSAKYNITLTPEVIFI